LIKDIYMILLTTIIAISHSFQQLELSSIKLFSISKATNRRILPFIKFTEQNPYI